MTFKHVQFEDSAIMRSLEKVAQEKGLIKPEPLTKTAAAKKTDLTPTTSLLDNVLKLCSGLRERGFEKQANDLEGHLVNYKVAQTLYETSPEKGEDVIHAAHPKGSHKLEGLDAENDGAVVEDILDQMTKTIQMIEKKPTGKLSNTKAISAVKLVLGAPPSPPVADGSERLYAIATDAIEKFRAIYDTIKMGMGDDAGSNDQYFNMLKDILDRKATYKQQGATALHGDFAASLTDTMNDLHNLEPSYFNLPWEHSAFSPDQQQRWANVKKYIPLLKKYADRFHAAVSQIMTLEGKEQTVQDMEDVKQLDPENEVVNKLNDLLSRLQQYAPKVSKYNAGASFVNDESAEIKALIDKLNQEGESPELSTEVASKEKEVNDFAASWQKVLA